MFPVIGLFSYQDAKSKGFLHNYLLLINYLNTKLQLIQICPFYKIVPYDSSRQALLIVNYFYNSSLSFFELKYFSAACFPNV
jgi:hypothetical protein